ncbi:MAG: cupin domain-containing protein [Acidiferrobacterales bacterium]
MPTIVKEPSTIRAAGNKPKVIEEFIGRVNSKTRAVSIARMRSPSGWIEPGQAPEFDEYTIVLKGTLRATSKINAYDVKEGEAIIAHAGEWIQYSTPGSDGAEYIAICVPAFSLEAVHRDLEG